MSDLIENAKLLVFSCEGSLRVYNFQENQLNKNGNVQWSSGSVSDSNSRGPGFET